MPWMHLKENGFSYLEITDNGIGMNVQEIRENFLTVGKTSKENNSEGLVGKYGIGILSVFLIGDYGEVYTKKENGEALSLKVYSEDDIKKVEWLESNRQDIEKDSYTVVKIRLSGHLKEKDPNYMEKLGLDTYVTKRDNSIRVDYMGKESELPKMDKDEWFGDLSNHIRLYRRKWLDIDEAELNEDAKELAKRLDRSGYVLYNDMLSFANFEISKYKQLQRGKIPFVMLDFKKISTVEEDIVTDLSRSNVQIAGDVMKTIAKGIYKFEIEKIIKIIIKYREALGGAITDRYELLKAIRNGSEMARDSIDILFYKEKLFFSRSCEWRHVNIRGSEEAARQLLTEFEEPILYYNLSMTRSLISDMIEGGRLICISVSYLNRYILEATSPRNGLRKEALIKILHFLDCQYINSQDNWMKVWESVKEN